MLDSYQDQFEKNNLLRNMQHIKQPKLQIIEEEKKGEPKNEDPKNIQQNNQLASGKDKEQVLGEP